MPEPMSEIWLPNLPEAIKNSGFAPDEMTIWATGQFQIESEYRLFRILGWQEAYPVESLPKSVKAGPRVRVKAKLNYHAKPPKLTQIAVQTNR